MQELFARQQSGELDVSSVKSTHCLKDDPTVGLNIWEAEDKEDFEMRFGPHKKYYAEAMEITPVITVEEAQKILMEQMVGK